MTLKQLRTLYRNIPKTGAVLDVGCFGFSQMKFAERFGLTQLDHFGVDYNEYTEVASHMIEHLVNPVEFLGDCIRVCKPGGFVCVEAPSERDLFLPGMPFDHDQFYSLSFFDDPTHVFRPWTPQSLYRLAKYYQSEPVCTGYRINWKYRLLFPLILIYALLARDGKSLEAAVWGALGWASYLCLRKPVSLHGKPAFNYYIPNR